MGSSPMSQPGDFNPRAYVRHDPPAALQEVTVTYFNPRAYVRHDLATALLYRSQKFQSTCLREARLPVS